MAKRRHRVPSSKTRPRRKRNSKSEVGDTDEGARVCDGEDVYSQGLSGECIDSECVVCNSMLFSSLQKNAVYWIILGLTVSASLSWLVYMLSVGMIKELALMPVSESDAIAFYHPSHKSYVVCVERPSSEYLEKPQKPRFLVKEPIELYKSASLDSDLIALAEPGDMMIVLDRRKEWIHFSKGLLVEGWTKIERHLYEKNKSKSRTNLLETKPSLDSGDEGLSSSDIKRESPNESHRRNMTSSEDSERNGFPLQRIRVASQLMHFTCFCAAGSGKGDSKVSSPYHVAIRKEEIPGDKIWRIPLFTQSAVFRRALLLGSGHGCIWCSDALLLGLSPIIWTFVNLPLGLFISLGTVLTDFVAFEVGEIWSLAILCTGCFWFFLCLMATYALELRGGSGDSISSERRSSPQLQFLIRPILDLLVLSVGVFLVGPCLAIPVYIFLLIRFYALPNTKCLDTNPSSNSSSIGMDCNKDGCSRRDSNLNFSSVSHTNISDHQNKLSTLDAGIYRDDTQVIYTCSLLKERFLCDHVVMSAIFVATCLTSHAFSTWHLFPDVRWVAIPQLYQFYCILKRGTSDGYVAICFAWQCLGIAFALRTGGFHSLHRILKDFDKTNSHLPWREYTLKQIIALGSFSLACGAIGVIPALLMFLTTLAKNPKAHLSANEEEIASARNASRTRMSSFEEGVEDGEGNSTGETGTGDDALLMESPDYCRVVADFHVKLSLVVMARALVSEFRFSRWIDYNLSNFFSYLGDIDIDPRAHMSLLTILGGGIATSIARRNWIPNLCSYALADRRALELVVMHRSESRISEKKREDAKIHETDIGIRKRNSDTEASNSNIKNMGFSSSSTTYINSEMKSKRKERKATFKEESFAYNAAVTKRDKFAKNVEKILSDQSFILAAFFLILAVAIFNGWPIMCIVSLLVPGPWESIVGSSIWTLSVSFWSICGTFTNLQRTADCIVLAFGFIAWTLKDAEISDTYEEDLKIAMNDAAGTKLSVAQKLKIGLEDRAVLGDVKAQFQMANLYAREGDPLRASDWWRQAANHGSKEAQLAIADCYATGKGVTVDMKLAIWWYERAADQGVLEAKAKLALLAEKKDIRSYSDRKENGALSSRFTSSSLPHALNATSEFKSSLSSSGACLGSRSSSDSEMLGKSQDRNSTRTVHHSRTSSHEVIRSVPPESENTIAKKGIGNLSIGTTFWGFISHGKLWRMPVKVEGKISGGKFPKFYGEWTAVGKVTCESQAIFINVKEKYGVVILGDRTTQAHLIFITEGRMEGEVFQEGVSGGSAVLEVEFPTNRLSANYRDS
eukprot:CAMPEP_0167746244 /NCGR_PEP_ID=MMETSP0110_2-20121227/3605_1 /TAXON_ID=629695 /ORGANISM="Gymnochlora sp., Strain CCMP2014" /LENGTH=1303 /DNA_ID=CAMNT_0007630987 /DNA_START=53 /DNA_END=3965 /DNA_ORIENTATION=-